MFGLGKRDGTGLVGLLSVTLSPALIMVMVGSLVWFLVDVFYGGQHPDRLLWCLSFFVFGVVLLARLSIEEGWQLAMGYSVALGGATFLAMLRFVEWKNTTLQAVGWAFSLGLMALAWWLANRLTWDCTHLDEERETSGRGLLASAQAAVIDAEPPAEAPKKKRRRDRDSAGVAWLTKFAEYRASRRNRPQTPGTWVLLFALAGLPIFALGQSFVPAEEIARRRATFLEAALFVGSGLLLLATTSLFGLCRYLQERGARVPLTMPLGWLSLAGILVMLFLAAGSLLPRPYAEVSALPSWISKSDEPSDKDANSRATDGSAGKGEGDRKGEGKGEGKGEPKSDGKKGESAGEKGKKPGGKSGEKGEKGDGQEKGDAPGEKSPDGPSKLQQATEAAGDLARWVVRILVILLIMAAVVWFVLKGLAPFTAWAQRLLDWFRNLFAGPAIAGRSAPVGDDGEVPAEAGPRFADFSNPFDDGSARDRTAKQLATYTFAALCAWGGDRGRPRLPGETPEEFARRLGAEFPAVAGPAGEAADLVVRAEFGRGAVPAAAAQGLAGVWRALGR